MFQWELDGWVVVVEAVVEISQGAEVVSSEDKNIVAVSQGYHRVLKGHTP